MQIKLMNYVSNICIKVFKINFNHAYHPKYFNQHFKVSMQHVFNQYSRKSVFDDHFIVKGDYHLCRMQRTTIICITMTQSQSTESAWTWGCIVCRVGRVHASSNVELSRLNYWDSNVKSRPRINGQDYLPPKFNCFSRKKGFRVVAALKADPCFFHNSRKKVNTSVGGQSGNLLQINTAD